MAFTNTKSSFLSDEATPHDVSLLLDHYKISTIVDLRTQNEIDSRTQEHASSNTRPDSRCTSISPITLTDDRHLEPDYSPTNNIATIDTVLINLNSQPYIRHLKSQLSYWSQAKFLALVTTGRHNQATSILGREVMAKLGPLGLAIDLLRFSKDEIYEFFWLLALDEPPAIHTKTSVETGKDIATGSENDQGYGEGLDAADRAQAVGGNNRSIYPILVHSTYGKDRTGLIIALLLLLCNIPLDAIAAEYMLSASELLLTRRQRVKELSSIGLPDDFADCPADWVESIDKALMHEWAGIDMYLYSGGLRSGEELSVIRSALCADK